MHSPICPATGHFFPAAAGLSLNRTWVGGGGGEGERGREAGHLKGPRRMTGRLLLDQALHRQVPLLS